MSIESIHDNMGNYLHVSGRVIDRGSVGGTINVGEIFTVRLRITNISRRAYAFLIWERVRIAIRDGAHATVVDGPQQGVYFQIATDLWPGRSTEYDVRLRATNELNAFEDFFNAEHLIDVHVLGDPDLSRLFRGYKKTEIKIDF